MKLCNYLNQILARTEAVETGAEEALLLDVHGLLAEGPGLEPVSGPRRRAPESGTPVGAAVAGGC